MREFLVRALLVTPLLLWGALVITLAGAPGGSVPPWRAVLAVFWCAAVLGALWRLRRPLAAGAVAALWLPVLAFFLLLRPADDRDWELHASRTPHATIDGDRVVLHDLRSFRWQPDGTYEARWRDKELRLDELEESAFVLTRFGGLEAVAHVMASFRFTGDRFVVLSVEIRRERGERYHPLGGAFRQYELFYVAADERDAIGLRTFVHGDPTWVIPMRAGPEANRAFFLDMVRRINALHEEPVWYNTVVRSCASELARHYEAVNDVRLGLDRRVFMPGFSDALLEELDLLPEGVDRETARALFQVNERALAHGDRPGFSRAIRGEAPAGDDAGP